MAGTYSYLHGLSASGRRFSTVYGPRGAPDMAYYSFTRSILEGRPIKLYNGGDLYRDFTHIKQVILANWKALTFDISGHQAIHVTCGKTTSLSELWDHIMVIVGTNVEVTYGPNRTGDVLHSLANRERLIAYLGVSKQYDFREDLARTVDYYKSRFYQD